MILFLISNSGLDSPLLMIFTAAIMTLLGLYGLAWTEQQPNNTAAPMPSHTDQQTWLYARYEKEYESHWSLAERMTFARIQYALERGEFPFELMKQLKAIRNEHTDETPTPPPLEKKAKPPTKDGLPAWEIVKKRTRNTQQFSS